MDRSPPAPASAHGRPPFPSATHKEGGADMDTTTILLVPLLVLGVVMAVAFANGAITNPAGTFTLEAWIRPASPGVVIGSYSLALARGFVLEVVQGPTALQARVRVGTGGGGFATATAVLGPGTSFNGWQHLVATYDNPGAQGAVTLYVNGSASTPTTGANYKDVRPAQAPPLRIGAGWNEPQEAQPGLFFKGGVDEVALY